jgi:hypothetical protein
MELQNCYRILVFMITIIAIELPQNFSRVIPSQNNHHHKKKSCAIAFALTIMNGSRIECISSTQWDNVQCVRSGRRFVLNAAGVFCFVAQCCCEIA